MERGLTKSTRKFIRQEKQRIRCQFLDVKKQKEEIDGLYKKILGETKVKDVKEAAPEKTEDKKETPKKKQKSTVKKII